MPAALEINMDNSLFVHESINEVIHALCVALVIVVVSVMSGFLDSLRSSGELKTLEQKWMGSAAGAPELKQ